MGNFKDKALTEPAELLKPEWNEHLVNKALVKYIWTALKKTWYSWWITIDVCGYN